MNQKRNSAHVVQRKLMGPQQGKCKGQSRWWYQSGEEGWGKIRTENPMDETGRWIPWASSFRKLSELIRLGMSLVSLFTLRPVLINSFVWHSALDQWEFPSPFSALTLGGWGSTVMCDVHWTSEQRCMYVVCRWQSCLW